MKFCVIGLGRFGYQVAVSLADRGMEVLAIDSTESIVNSIQDKVTQVICMHVKDEESLRAVGVEEMDTVIIGMGENLAESILITSLLKKRLDVPHVIARSTSQIHSEILKLVGADRVILPEQEIGIRLANNLSLPFVDLVHITEEFAVTQMKAPRGFIGKTINELNLRKSRHVTCVAVKKGEELVLTNLDYVILENDELVFVGTDKNLASLAHV
jgi:trk system potassium uptake protein